MLLAPYGSHWIEVCQKHTNKEVRGGKVEDVQYTTESNDKKTIHVLLGQSYENILSHLEASKVSPSKNEDYKPSVSIGIRTSSMCRNVFDTGACQKIYRSQWIGPKSLDTIQQRNELEIWVASDALLRLSGTTTVHLCLGEYRPFVCPSAIDKLVVLDLIWKLSLTGLFSRFSRPKGKQMHSLPGWYPS